MTSQAKKIITVAVFILACFILGIALYFVFFRSMVPTNAPTENINGEGGLPVANENANLQTIENINGGLLSPSGNINTGVSQIAGGGKTATKTITTDTTKGMTMDANGAHPIFYDDNDSFFYTTDANGNLVKYSDRAFYNVDKVTWAADKEKAVLEYPDGSNIVYNFKTKKQTTLPQHWEDFSFSPDSNLIAAKSIHTEEKLRYVVTTDPDGSQIKPIFYLGDGADITTINWSPNNQVVGYYMRGKGLDEQKMIMFDSNGNKLSPTYVRGRDFRGYWSPKGDRLLYSVYSSDNDFKPKLWMVEASGPDVGKNRLDLSINTWANKCTFYDDYRAYCGVPTSLETGAGIVPATASGVPDLIYDIDLKTGAKKLIAEPEQNINIGSIIVSKDGKYLYVTDANTNQIKSIQIKY